jgi:hypothetical protein
VVIPPLPSGSGIPIGGISMLGRIVMVLLPCPLVMLAFEKGIPSVVIRGRIIVIVVVVVKKVVMTSPPLITVVPPWPYSSEVV